MSNVYIMVAQNQQLKYSFAKIGVARDIESRIKQLQTGCPFKIGTAFGVKFDDEKLAYRVEAAIHKILESNNTHGEWFMYDPDAIWDAFDIVFGVLGVELKMFRVGESDG